MPTPADTTTRLATAIDKFSQCAEGTFNGAYPIANTPEPADPTLRAAWVKARGQMASALQQLAQADTMRAELRGRVGYDEVVKLMEETRVAAAAVHVRIKELLPVGGSFTLTSAQRVALNQQLEALGHVLDGLARVAPVPVWEKEPSAGGKNE